MLKRWKRRRISKRPRLRPSALNDAPKNLRLPTRRRCVNRSPTDSNQRRVGMHNKTQQRGRLRAIVMPLLHGKAPLRVLPVPQVTRQRTIIPVKFGADCPECAVPTAAARHKCALRLGRTVAYLRCLSCAVLETAALTVLRLRLFDALVRFRDLPRAHAARSRFSLKAARGGLCQKVRKAVDETTFVRHAAAVLRPVRAKLNPFRCIFSGKVSAFFARQGRSSAPSDPFDCTGAWVAVACRGSRHDQHPDQSV